jgi:hypothetical protein
METSWGLGWFSTPMDVNIPNGFITMFLDDFLEIYNKWSEKERDAFMKSKRITNKEEMIDRIRLKYIKGLNENSKYDNSFITSEVTSVYIYATQIQKMEKKYVVGKIASFFNEKFPANEYEHINGTAGFALKILSSRYY